MAHKKVLVLRPGVFGFQVRQALSAQGVDLAAAKQVTVPVAYRQGARRKVSACLVQHQLKLQGCCDNHYLPYVRVVRKRDGRVLADLLG